MGARDDEERLHFDRRIGGRMPHIGASRSFAILRCAKIKTLGNMGASLQHTFRERDTPNADTRRTPDNTVLVGGDTSQAVLDAWKDRAPEKIRSNAVHGLEYFVGGSPEALKAMSRQEQDAYFSDALNWLKARHGAENVLSAVIHRDETTPHMTVMTIPLDERGKLNARAIVGSRERLSAMQTDFAERVGKVHGLERGLQGSPARHERVQRAYAHLSDPDAAVSLPERRKGAILGIGGETDAEWRQRASEAASDALRGVQAARHRENRDHAAEVFALKQQITGTPKMQTELSKLQHENRRLQRDLKATETRAELIAQQNRRLGAIQDGMVAGGRAFARENGLDEKAFMTRLQTAAKEALEALDAPAAQPTVKAKAPTRTRIQLKPAIEHAPKAKPVVQEQVRDEPGVEHRIKPKDDAWDDGH
ncbi:MobV family relaxase [Paracoccus fontiphilus]|nr:MobV family relaxase [Paracoccus fontiphilus]